MSSVVKIKELPTPERKIIDEVRKLILVNPARSASGERPFSTVRRLKTWLVSLNNDTRAIYQLDNIKQS